MSTPSPTPPPPASESGPAEQTDFNIGEEYGTARKSLPPAGIVAICLAVVVAIAAAYRLPIARTRSPAAPSATSYQSRCRDRTWLWLR